MTVATKQEKTFLVKVLQQSLKWSESQLRSFTEDSLNEIYEYLLDGYVIAKAKTNNSHMYNIYITIPKVIRDYMGINKSEWVDILVNLHKKEIVLDRNKENRIKIKNKGIYLPYKLAEKNLLKANDDTAVIAKGDKIILKSFTYFQ
ncbi:hypothetical protein [Bacillus xiapuensis]|uniref:Uncharacterized protein n=1 Tax=Bacillus xiapuensis TaxID=2014075 RepID=A0ABU6N7V7_9BACI|nr:hypothetical protein [Bacillus xiapuensis]